MNIPAAIKATYTVIALILLPVLFSYWPLQVLSAMTVVIAEIGVILLWLFIYDIFSI